MNPKTMGMYGIALGRLTEGPNAPLKLGQALRHLAREADDVEWDEAGVPFLRGSAGREAFGEDAVGEALADRVRVQVRKTGAEPLAPAPVIDPAGELLAMKKKLMEDRARASQSGARTLNSITTKEGFLK